MGPGRLNVGLALALVAGLLAAGCGGSPRDLGSLMSRVEDSNGRVGGTLVEIEGIVPAPAAIEPRLVEVDPDGRALTAFFHGGDPHCQAVAGVDVERRDPEIPRVTIRYGMRLWIMGCNAALASLAIRVPLDPPFAP